MLWNNIGTNDIFLNIYAYSSEWIYIRKNKEVRINKQKQTKIKTLHHLRNTSLMKA